MSYHAANEETLPFEEQPSAFCTQPAARPCCCRSPPGRDTTYNIHFTFCNFRASASTWLLSNKSVLRTVQGQFGKRGCFFFCCCQSSCHDNFRQFRNEGWRQHGLSEHMDANLCCFCNTWFWVRHTIINVSCKLYLGVKTPFTIWDENGSTLFGCLRLWTTTSSSLSLLHSTVKEMQRRHQEQGYTST